MYTGEIKKTSPLDEFLRREKEIETMEEEIQRREKEMETLLEEIIHRYRDSIFTCITCSKISISTMGSTPVSGRTQCKVCYQQFYQQFLAKIPVRKFGGNFKLQQ